MNDERTERLAAVFRAALGLGPRCDVHSLTQSSTEKWDSLAHVMLVSAIENEFSVTIGVSESLALNSFTGAQRLLQSKLAGAGAQ